MRISTSMQECRVPAFIMWSVCFLLPLHGRTVVAGREAGVVAP